MRRLDGEFFATNLIRQSVWMADQLVCAKGADSPYRDSASRRLSSVKVGNETKNHSRILFHLEAFRLSTRKSEQNRMSRLDGGRLE